MNGQLILSYPWYLTAFCVLLGLAVSGWLYYKDELLNGRPVLKGGLFFARAILVSALAFLLLGPFWKGFNTKTEKPVVLYLEDVSTSVANYTGAGQLSVFKQQRDELLEGLEKDFEVERYKFGSDLVTWGDSLTGQAMATNISQSLNSLLEMHSYQNVGAVILASDGIYNQGYNPGYSNLAAGTSVYTIALGDSTPSRDLFVQALQYPKVVYLGDKFQLDIEWGAKKLRGTIFSMSVSDDAGKELMRKSISVDQDEQYGRESVILDALTPGIRKIAVRLSTGATEDVSANNLQFAYVEVLDGRKNVLLLYDSPHPDIKALRTVIDQNKNYEATTSSLAEFQGDLNTFDLVVLHGWPSERNGELSRRIWSQCVADGRSVMAVLTAGSELSSFNRMQSVLQVEVAGSQMNDVQALANATFRDFQWPERTADALRYFPPLKAPFAEFNAGPDTKILLYQRLGDINTGYPLVIAGQEGESRVMVVAGEGLWRWRMAEFAREGDTEVFDELVNQWLQYVTVKEDKRKFRLLVQESLTWENEPVRLSAELYNANYELVNEPEVTVSITAAGGDTYEFTMDKTLNAYFLDAGLLPVGNYTAVANANWAGNTYDAATRFTVREVQLETLRKQADHQLLFNLSAATGGSMFNIDDLSAMRDAIAGDVNLKPVLYQSEKTTSLLQFQWIFFLLLGLLTMEWVTRKWVGGY